MFHVKHQATQAFARLLVDVFRKGEVQIDERWLDRERGPRWGYGPDLEADVVVGDEPREGRVRRPVGNPGGGPVVVVGVFDLDNGGCSCQV